MCAEISADCRSGTRVLESVCLFYFSTHGHIPTARPGPSLAAAVSALPLPQPSSPPATMWAPGRPPPSWGPSVQQIGIWAIGPARALERPHRDSTPTSDFRGTYVKPPWLSPTPKYPVPAPPSFKCRGMFGDQRTSDRFRGRFRCMAPLWFLILRPLQRSHAGHP